MPTSRSAAPPSSTAGPAPQATPAAAASSSAPGAAEEDDEEFESASENEWDPRKETEAEAGGANIDEDALTRAAEQAAAAEEAAEAEELAEQASGLSVSADARSSANMPGPGASLTSTSAPSSASAREKASSSSSLFGSKGVFGGLMKGLGASSSSSGPTAPVPDESIGTPIATVEGSWLSHVDINGTRMWSIATERPERWMPVADPLASDCRYRSDLVTLSTGDLKAAQKAKEALEERQRADKRIRETVLGKGHH